MKKKLIDWEKILEIYMKKFLLRIYKKSITKMQVP